MHLMSPKGVWSLLTTYTYTAQARSLLREAGVPFMEDADGDQPPSSGSNKKGKGPGGEACMHDEVYRDW